jgi:hypothetical protein
MHEIHTSGKRETQPTDARSKKTAFMDSGGVGACHLFPPKFFEKSKIKKEGNIPNINTENCTPRLLLLCL